MGQPGDGIGEGVTPEVSPPPHRAKRTIVAAALVGALAGGLVSYPVAMQVAERNSGGVPVFTNTAQGTASDDQADAPAGSVAAIVDSIRPSIVAVRTTSLGRDTFLQPLPAQGAGTGIVLDSRGHILTNAHVVEGAETIDVIVDDGRSLDARVIGRDRLTDLAVLRVSADDLQPAKFGNSNSIRVGDPVIAVGHALALRGGPTVTVGIISALDRTIQPTEGTALEHVIQTDAAINPGNSGGPLLNVSGEVIGLNTAIAGGAQSIGFAIAITPAKEIVNQLVTDGQIVRPYLGVSMADVTPELAEQESLTVTEGAYVIQVVVDRGADRAGILPGDVIVEIEGKTIASSEDAVDVIAGYKPEDRINIVVVRGSERLRLVATLTQRD
jgi:S1-C subfamily serine protease